MAWSPFKKEPTDLDKAIHDVYARMRNLDLDSPEYAKLVNHVTGLETLKANSRPKRISHDTVAIVLGNLAGIVIMVAYEHGHVIVSKAAQQLLKPKI